MLEFSRNGGIVALVDIKNPYLFAIAFYDRFGDFIYGISNPETGVAGQPFIVSEQDIPENAKFFVATQLASSQKYVKYSKPFPSLVSDLSKTSSFIKRFELLRNTYINHQGIESIHQDWSCTDFIEISYNIRVYNAFGYQPWVATIAYYDENRNFISDYTPRTEVNGNLVNIPAGAVYFRASSNLKGFDVVEYAPMSEYVNKALNYETISKIKEIEIVQDSYVNHSGVAMPSDDHIRTSLTVLEEDCFLSKCYGNAEYVAAIAYYDKNGHFISEFNALSNVLYSDISPIESAPVGSVYFIASLNKENGTIEYYKKTTQTKEILKLMDKSITSDEIEMIAGHYINHEGQLTSHIGSEIDIWYASDFIPLELVSSISKISGNADYVASAYFYDANKQPIGETTLETLYRNSFPSEAKYARISSHNQLPILKVDTSLLTAQGYINLTNLSQDNYAVTTQKNVLNISTSLLIQGNSLTLPLTPDVKNNHVISFSAQLVTPQNFSIKISHSGSIYSSGVVEVTNTQIIAYNVSTVQTTIDHGFTFKDFITVLIIVGTTPNQAKVRLISNHAVSEDFTVYFNGCQSNIVAAAITGDFKNVHLNLGGSGFSKHVWIFMDSYSDMVPSQFYAQGAKNFLLDAYSGRDSAGGLLSLKKLLRFATPKVVVWGLGMNDPDNSDSINGSWQSTVEEARQLCDSIGAVFVPTTTPNVPQRIHSYKNQYVKANFDLYVDLASSCGAEETGSDWFDGLLGVDRVHPTAAGCLVIASEYIRTIPEIMLQD